MGQYGLGLAGLRSSPSDFLQESASDVPNMRSTSDSRETWRDHDMRHCVLGVRRCATNDLVATRPLPNFLLIQHWRVRRRSRSGSLMRRCEKLPRYGARSRATLSGLLFRDLSRILLRLSGRAAKCSGTGFAFSLCRRPPVAATCSGTFASGLGDREPAIGEET